MKTILITGAGTGLGKELALAYAQEGNRIILVGRTQSHLDEVRQMIGKTNGSAMSASCDITDSNRVEQLLFNLNKTEKIDQVINNAGIGYFGPLQEISADKISHMIDTNVKGTIYITKAILPTFLERNAGKIMNIISTAGLRGKVHETAYCASKFAIRGFTEALVKELENTSISVSGVYMGGMDTPFWDENNFVTDRSRLKSAKEVAWEILERETETELIIG
ncbi:short-subunit dehydrogenase [Neobacillus bataviensis]|uniref:Short-subunit dehydrogenase n=1 Tax=Neobacillus bataviensis TaxID=220685 RepID=A0A561DCK8_9BACI|nr:SDR family NAD(P)-dependent oxidoreductase [Neobacillus bataviensis]TWE01048.1 short-subunit dehydrogenase [Neobacillus bataviensis]